MIQSHQMHLYDLSKQTLETAFLQLCEDSDQSGPKQSPQGRLLDSSPSPDSMRDEIREPILRKSTPEDMPKYKGTTEGEVEKKFN